MTTHKSVVEDHFNRYFLFLVNIHQSPGVTNGTPRLPLAFTYAILTWTIALSQRILKVALQPWLVTHEDGVPMVRIGISECYLAVNIIKPPC